MLIFAIAWMVISAVRGQEDLLAELEAKQEPATTYAIQTFKGTRLVNGHSVETKGEGELEFIFSHRFGTLNSGSYNLWGLDDAFVRLGLEYGITSRLGVGIGRSSTDKTFDGFLRYRLTRQSRGVRNFPFTVTALGSYLVKTSPRARDNPSIAFNDRLAYTLQLMIARKFSGFSLQLTPIFVHRNAVFQSVENNDDLALSLGGRAKITRSISLMGEYCYRLNPRPGSPYFDAVGFGVDIETGGHVFQLVFTNSLGMVERAIVAETDGDFFDGDVHFGFNITRTFQLVGKR